MDSTNKKYLVAVISHKRPQNVQSIMQIVGEDCAFYVNDGEKDSYLSAGAHNVFECGTNICQARNRAIEDSVWHNLPSIQVSDDLRSIKKVSLKDGNYNLEPIAFSSVCNLLIHELNKKSYYFGGVAVSSNRLNYTGQDITYDKLIVNDLICVMPTGKLFDEEMALKEDYDMTIRCLLGVGGLVRLNNILCDFPHRENKGGANTYRNRETEQAATDKLYKKWGNLIKKHPTREGQISLNYEMIKQKKNGQQQLF